MTNKEAREIVWKNMKEDFLILNRTSIRILGLKNSVFLAELMRLEKFLFNSNLLNKDNYFYHKQSLIKYETTLTYKQQKKACDELENLNILKTKKEINNTIKKYYKINHFFIYEKCFKITKSAISNSKKCYNPIAKSAISNSKKCYRVIAKSANYKNRTNLNRTNLNRSLLHKDNRFEKPVNSDNSPNREIKKTKQPKINNFTIKIITLWNNCPAVPIKHKTNKYYKFHSKVQKYITHLKTGTFGDIIDLSKDYMKRCCIMEKDLTKKYTEAEIEKIISNCLLAYKEGYWPTNKKILPKSISELFYCTPFYSTKYVPGEAKSHFLYIHARPPRKLRKPKPSESFKREIEANKPVLTEEEEKALIKRLEEQVAELNMPVHLRKYHLPYNFKPKKEKKK